MFEKRNIHLFSLEKPVIGMVHVNALPGTPKYKGDFNEVVDCAVQEALLYKDCGLQAIMIENMHDVPYLKKEVGAEIVAAMTVVGHEIKRRTKLVCGVQILAGANKQALAVAKAANLDFIRAEGFIFGHIADEGYIDSDAAELLRYRKLIDAEHILILSDIKKKHSSHQITNDVSLLETAKAAEFFLSDGVIISGSSTGQAVDVNELKTIYNKLNIPILIGSGITDNNFNDYRDKADGFIVGSYFKKNGFWSNEIEPSRVEKLMAKQL